MGSVARLVRVRRLPVHLFRRSEKTPGNEFEETKNRDLAREMPVWHTGGFGTMQSHKSLPDVS
jgi:hypothetical protein